MDRMGFGAFLSPLHPLGEDPALSLWRDLELAEWLDQLGFDELWVGEHHSAGWGTVSSPELFIATAAERTRHIRLGTGVVSLPYHHPFMVASRAVQLDQLTRGRFTLGVGAGSIPSDMHFLGIDPADTRRRTAESLEVILQLLDGEKPVTHRTDWFELRDARLQLRPYAKTGLPLAVSSATSPSVCGWRASTGSARSPSASRRGRAARSAISSASGGTRRKRRPSTAARSTGPTGG